jgi:hypothetical protein
MLAKVLVYGDCVGVLLSRRIPRRLVEDVAFRALAAGNQPAFPTTAGLSQAASRRRWQGSSSRCRACPRAGRAAPGTRGG